MNGMETWAFYVSIAILVLDVLMFGKKVFKLINIRRKVVHTNEDILNEINKINNPELQETIDEVKQAKKKLLEAEKKAKQRLSIYQKAEV